MNREFSDAIENADRTLAEMQQEEDEAPKIKLEPYIKQEPSEEEPNEDTEQDGEPDDEDGDSYEESEEEEVEHNIELDPPAGRTRHKHRLVR
jgi:hypothetical protein